MPDAPAITPERPRRRRRWFVAAALLLAAAYPASEGPLRYAVQRGWIADSTATLLARPAEVVARFSPLWNARQAYLDWWTQLGRWHMSEVFIFEITPHATDGVNLSTHKHPDGWSTLRTNGRVTPSSVESSHLLHSRDGVISVRNGRVLFRAADNGPVAFDEQEVAVLPPVWTRLEVRRSFGRFTVEVE